AVIASITKLTTAFDNTAPMLRNLYMCVGVASILLYFWFAIITKEGVLEFCRDGAAAAFFLLLIPRINRAMSGSSSIIFTLLALMSFAAFCKFVWDTRKLGMEWLVVIVCGLLCILGISFYFYEPLAGMTNPPMQWGYPRTVEGFWHALSRGQYEKTVPSDNPFRYFYQIGLMFRGIKEEFNWVYALLALVPFGFFPKMQRRERAWMIGLFGVYCCMGFFLALLLNQSGDRQSLEIGRVQFTASHFLITIWIGYGLTLIAACMSANYKQFRKWGIIGGIAAFIF